MIRKSGSYSTEVKENMFGGTGKVTIERLWNHPEDLQANNRLFAKLTLAPNSAIGYHTHDNEEEIFVITRGEAEANDNGNIVHLKTGDTILTVGGSGHAIKNIGNDPLEILAVISCY